MEATSVLPGLLKMNGELLVQRLIEASFKAPSLICKIYIIRQMDVLNIHYPEAPHFGEFFSCRS